MFTDATKRNILINFRGGIGDFILLTPLLRNIRENGRDDLFFIGGKELQGFVAGYDYFKEPIYVNYGGSIFHKLITLIKLFFKFRNLKIHICITPICSLGKFVYLVTKLSMAEKRIGFEHEKTTGIYTDVIKIDDRERDIEQNLEILEILGLRCVTKDTELTIPDHSFEMVEDYFLKLNIDLARTIIAVAPLVKGMENYPSREWPLDKYVKLIEKLIKVPNVNIILMGNKNELHKLERIRELRYSDKVFLQDKSFSVYEAAAILKHCMLLICNDGGLMHVASAIDIPVVSIWGPTNPGIRGYLEKRNFFSINSDGCPPCREYKKLPVKCEKRECLEKIPVEEVFRICTTFLNENLTLK